MVCQYKKVFWQLQPYEAVQAFEQLGGKFAVMKAQVHAGGRGKAGGVKVVKSAQEAAEYANQIHWNTSW